MVVGGRCHHTHPKHPSKNHAHNCTGPYYWRQSPPFGCYINNVFYGIFGYTDDLVLQCMLNLAKSFLEKLGLKISVNHAVPKKSKTKCVAFGIQRDPHPISLNDINLPWSDSYTHLRHVLCKNGLLKLYVDLKRHSFIGKFHEFRHELKNPYP